MENDEIELAIQQSDQSLPFELMCDASDYTVLGQKKDGKLHAIYYARSRKTLNRALINYATTKIELLVVVFAMENVLPDRIKSDCPQ